MKEDLQTLTNDYALPIAQIEVHYEGKSVPISELLDRLETMSYYRLRNIEREVNEALSRHKGDRLAAQEEVVYRAGRLQRSPEEVQRLAAMLFPAPRDYFYGRGAVTEPKEILPWQHPWDFLDYLYLEQLNTLASSMHRYLPVARSSIM